MNINIDCEALVRKLLEKGFERGVKFQKETNNINNHDEELIKLKNEVIDLIEDINILDLIAICKLELRDESTTFEQAELLINDICPFYGDCPHLDNRELKFWNCIRLYFGIMENK